VIAAKDTELEPALSELKAALRQHTECLRKLAAAELITHSATRESAATTLSE
jgi:hypothetical protein